MKRANIYKAVTDEYLAYLNLSDNLNGRFNIFEKDTNNCIAYGNINNLNVIVYDSNSDLQIEYGMLNGKRIDFYDFNSRQFLKYCLF